MFNVQIAPQEGEKAAPLALESSYVMILKTTKPGLGLDNSARTTQTQTL